MEKLRKIYLVSAALIYIHGLEEIYGGFQHVDSFMKFGANIFGISTEAFYWLFHLIWWLLIPLVYLLVFKFHKTKNILYLFSLVYVLEVHHLVKAIAEGHYYPGMLTALFYPLVGFLFIKQLILISKSEPLSHR